MLLPLILGIILGGLTVIFALQNVGEVSLQFFAWTAQVPLAIALMTSLFSGMAVTLLTIFPSLVRDEIKMRAIKSEKREVEDELAQHRFAKKKLPTHNESEPHTPHRERNVFA